MLLREAESSGPLLEVESQSTASEMDPLSPQVDLTLMLRASCQVICEVGAQADVVSLLHLDSTPIYMQHLATQANNTTVRAL